MEICNFIRIFLNEFLFNFLARLGNSIRLEILKSEAPNAKFVSAHFPMAVYGFSLTSVNVIALFIVGPLPR